MKTYRQRHAQIKEGGFYYKFNVRKLKIKSIRRTKFRGIRLETNQQILEKILI